MGLRNWLIAGSIAGALGFAGALGLAAPAHADQRTPAFYLGLGAGINFMPDADIDGMGIGTEADYDTGLAGAITLGFKRADGFRSEFEIAGRTNDVDQLQGMGSADGDVDALTFMGNILYDFQRFGKFKPYVGFGVGLARVRFDGVRPIGGGLINDHDMALAFQGIAGMSFELTDRFEVFGDYRYMGTADLDVQEATSGATVSADYRNHTVMAGLRIALYSPPQRGVQPKPMAPAPIQPAAVKIPPEPEPSTPPPLARNFIVFFDWDSSDLTPTASEIVLAAANETDRVKLHVRLTGHADTSGADLYNMALSKRRAQTVRDEMVKLGVSTEDIGLSWKGERTPLVPTPDGIREPQNRRVEIVVE